MFQIYSNTYYYYKLYRIFFLSMTIYLEINTSGEVSSLCEVMEYIFLRDVICIHIIIIHITAL